MALGKPSNRLYTAPRCASPNSSGQRSMEPAFRPARRQSALNCTEIARFIHFDVHMDADRAPVACLYDYGKSFPQITSLAVIPENDCKHHACRNLAKSVQNEAFYATAGSTAFASRSLLSFFTSTATKNAVVTHERRSAVGTASTIATSGDMPSAGSTIGKMR